MAELFDLDPLGRFAGLADVYARSRPTYPKEMIDLLISRCGLGGNSLIVDVGSGTGISSRLFASHDIPVVGIEPNQEMRSAAEAEPWEELFPPLQYRAGQAEATDLPDQIANLVLAAQAFHWFKPELALAEFHRILKSDGWTALVWNERDEADPFTAAYGKVIRTTPKAAGIEGPRRQAGDRLLVSPLFQHAQRLTFRHEQTVDQEGLVSRALSASYAPRDPNDIRAFTQALQEVFARFEKNWEVTIAYETSLFLAQKRFHHQ
jgi:ubiquinone/menaquinone biosynthesis C-methylase UbiE